MLTLNVPGHIFEINKRKIKLNDVEEKKEIFHVFSDNYAEKFAHKKNVQKKETSIKFLTEFS